MARKRYLKKTTLREARELFISRFDASALETEIVNIDQALNRRCLIGAFPIPIEGGEASPCRVVAFIDE